MHGDLLDPEHPLRSLELPADNYVRNVSRLISVLERRNGKLIWLITKIFSFLLYLWEKIRLISILFLPCYILWELRYAVMLIFLIHCAFSLPFSFTTFVFFSPTNDNGNTDEKEDNGYCSSHHFSFVLLKTARTGANDNFLKTGISSP